MILQIQRLQQLPNTKSSHSTPCHCLIQEHDTYSQYSYFYSQVIPALGGQEAGRSLSQHFLFGLIYKRKKKISQPNYLKTIRTSDKMEIFKTKKNDTLYQMSNTKNLTNFYTQYHLKQRCKNDGRTNKTTDFLYQDHSETGEVKKKIFF